MPDRSADRSQLSTQCRDLGFRGRQSLAEGSQHRLELGGGVARGDVLGAVPVEGVDRHHDRALDDRVVVGVGESGDEFGVVVGVHDPGVAEDLEAPLVA